MRQLLIPALFLALAAAACVPREQYQALEVERNYYRNQIALADSLADQQAISSYDEVGDSGAELTRRIRQVEALTATNVSLNNSYQALKTRYEELLSQSQSLLTTSGNEVSDLQASLAERTTAISQREEELRALEVDLMAREEAIARIEGDYAPAGGGAPQSYGSAGSAPQPYGAAGYQPTTLSAGQNAALQINEIQNDVSSLLGAYPAGGYRLTNEGNQLRVSLNPSMLTDDGFTVSRTGQRVLQSLAGVLRNHPAAEVSVIGHTGNAGGNALRAYEDSSDKAINVAQQLITFGVNPRKVTVAAKGFYDPVSNGISQADQTANQRTELLISVFEY